MASWGHGRTIEQRLTASGTYPTCADKQGSMKGAMVAAALGSSPGVRFPNRTRTLAHLHLAAA